MVNVNEYGTPAVDNTSQESEQYAFIEADVTSDVLSSIGSYSWIRRGAVLESAALGNDVFVGFEAKMYSCTIGRKCLIASRSTIGSPRGVETRLGENVWVGAQAEIAGGVIIGNGAVIGAGAHVSEDVPEYAVVVGRPAHFLRWRHATMNSDGSSYRDLLYDVKQRLTREWRTQEREILLKRNFARRKSSFGSQCFLDADIRVGVGVTLGNRVVAIGRKIQDANKKLILDGGVEIGDNVVIGSDCLLEGGGKITIGADTRVGASVHIVSTTHDDGYLSLPLVAKPVGIGNGVIIGENAVILGGVTIGDGARISAGAVVIKDVPAYQISKGIIFSGQKT